MIKKFIDKLLGKTSRAARSPWGQRQDVPASVHGIDRQQVDPRAVDVVRALQRAGFEAYIVGGAVRDLLLGLRPKDFDVATNATPEQVKNLFRRAFIIGRRFRIVHVVHGRGRDHEVIEVSTFRAHLDSADAEQVRGNERTSKGELAGMKHAVDASGRVLRDNVWGPIEQDAARRDFSINAMYYDPETQIVVDFHQGIRDAQKKTLRMIGEPSTRYREDPVRVIRAVRFAAKLASLGFKLDTKTREPLVASRELLRDVPQSRLFDEMLKLLQTGHALSSIATLQTYGLGQGIYPLLDLVVQRVEDPFVQLALQDTDRRVAEGKPVAPSFLLACIMWADVRQGWQRRLQPRGQQQRPPSPFAALQDAVDETFEARIGDVSGRGKLGTDMREIWMMQPRLDKRVGTSPFSLVDQPRFRAGFDFLRLRAQVGEIDEELAHWWETFSTADDDHRQDMVDAQRKVPPQSKSTSSGKTRRVHQAASGGPPPSTGDTTSPPSTPTTSSTDRNKRSTDSDSAGSMTTAQTRYGSAFTLDSDQTDDAEGYAADDTTAQSTAAPAPKRRRRRRKSANGSDKASDTGTAPTD